MPILYTFCSWFSVRMGSVIVGCLSLVSICKSNNDRFNNLGCYTFYQGIILQVQGVCLLLLGIAGYQNHELISFIFETIVEENDVLFAESYFIYIYESKFLKIIFNTF